jgi:hypothetical protein
VQNPSHPQARRNLEKLADERGPAWVRNYLEYRTTPLLREQRNLDLDRTEKPVHGREEGAKAGHHRRKPGRPSTQPSHLVGT